MIEDGRVRFVCTDRGSHPSRELAEVHVDERGAEGTGELERLRATMPEEEAQDEFLVLHINAMIAQEHSGMRRRHHGEFPKEGVPPRSFVSATPPGQPWKRWRFKCPTCGRDVQLRHATLAGVLQKVIEAFPDTPVPRVDISHLPANLH